MFGEIVKANKGVDTIPLSEIAECIAGATPTTKEKKYWENGTVPWLSSGEVEQGRVFRTATMISEIGYRSCSTRMLPKKSILIAMAGQGKTRGYVGISEIELCTNQSVCGLKLKPSVNPEFLYWNLRLQYSRLREASNGDAGRGGLNLGILSSFKVLWPSDDLQQTFATYANEIDKLKFNLQQAIEKAKRISAKILNDALTEE